MNIRENIKHLLRMFGHALISTLHDRLGYLEQQVRTLNTQNVNLAETQATLLEATIHALEILQRPNDQSTAVEISSSRHSSPEGGLLEFLYSYLPTRKVLDIGAHVGDISECLLNAGYEVYAVEPNPPVFVKLARRLGDRKGFHPFCFAIGCEEGEMPLHLAEDRSASRRYNDASLFSSLIAHRMPDDIVFVDTTPVQVRNLAGLHQANVIPGDVSLVKIDTEGFDLEVIRGMGDHRYQVVVAEFWDKETPIAGADLPYTFESLVREMRNRGYAWHIVLYQIWMASQSGFYSNYSQSVPNSWGNVFFFQDYRIFSEAQAWCSAVLPRTYFKSVPSSNR